MRVYSSSPLWRKIDRIAAAREASSAEQKREAVATRQRRLRFAEARDAKKYHRALVRQVAQFSALPATAHVRILKEVAAKHQLTVRDLVMSDRRQRFTRPRFEAFWRLYSETTMSLPQIGRHMGGRDHTTALHAIEAYMDRNGIAERPAHRRRGA